MAHSRIHAAAHLGATAAVLLTLAACGSARREDPSKAGTTCLGCHGGTHDASGAPPRDTAGRTASPKVGAHTAHLAAGVACQACHVVPTRIADAGHINGSSVPVFGGPARLGGAAPSYDPATGTCSDVYCHGARLPPAARGPSTAPAWNGAPLAGGACGSCHGGASNSGAPANHGPLPLTPADCSHCHPGTVDATGRLIAGGKHLNGAFPDITGDACVLCHGDAGRAEAVALVQAAPPKDHLGATSGSRVGAHLAHLHAGPLAQAFACSECHAVPSGTDHAALAQGDAKVRFATAPGDVARGVAGTLNPAYAAGTCSDVYCHGAGLLGGSNKAPGWTTPTSAACGACHFLADPPPPHPASDVNGDRIAQATQCAQCHPGTVDAAGRIIVPALPTLSLHVNGTKDITQHPDHYATRALHGKDARAAGNLQARCKACHGATLDGGLGGAAPSCNACHAANGHPDWQTECVFCHGDANRASDAAFGDVGTPPTALGKVAPPRGAQDEATAGDPAVGAHLAHVQAGPLAGAFQCSQCHGPALPANTDHVNGQVVIGWALAASGGVTVAPLAGTVTRAAPVSCDNYCHGKTLRGGAAVKVVGWTDLSGTAAACGTCHGVPPPYAGAFHVPYDDCATCHGFDRAAVDTAKHLNGAIDLAATVGCGTCHGDLAANGNFAPPRAASAAVATPADPRVGAHQAHVKAGPLAGAIACTECHGALPTTVTHANGGVTIAWSVRAATGVSGGAAPAPLPAAGTVAPGSTGTCANYCHGSKWQGDARYAGATPTPRWTAGPGEAACGACHLAPPASTAHLSVGPATNCGSCHAGYDCTTGAPAACQVNLADHVNGRLDVANLGCTSCHGGASGNAAPPLGTRGETATTALAVGAHQSHVRDTPLSRAIGCGACHPVPGTTLHATGTVEVAFSGLSVAGGATPAWSRGTATCSGAYCHGATLSGGSLTAPAWTTVNGSQAGCGTCHGLPPAAPHPAIAAPGDTHACNACHGETVSAAGAVIPPASGGKHLDGHLDVQGHPLDWMDPLAAGFHGGAADRGLSACQACHGAALDGGVAAVACSSCHGAAWKTSCTMCHGGTNDQTGAPPKTIWGQGADPVRTGAHAAHLAGSALAPPFGCESCHVKPAGALDAGHIDPVAAPGVPRATVTFSGLASQGVATPAWDRPSASCATYCHGATLSGGSIAAPTWTTLDGSQAACGTCHGLPPGRGHPAVTGGTPACNTCHAQTVDAAGAVIAPAAGGKHLDGQVEVSGHPAGWMDQASPGFHAFSADAGLSSCQACHGAALDGGLVGVACATCHGASWKTTCTMCHGGTDSQTGAPPRATWGHGSDPVRVGAHTRHLAGGALTKPIACATCHAVPADALAPGHLGGGFAAVQLTGAGAAGPAAAWTRATATCATWCHGSGLSGGSLAAPTWTTLDGSQAACGTCHGVPPTSGKHWHVTDDFANCADCHGLPYGDGLAVDLAVHVNGTVNVGSAVTSWSNGTCTSLCHGSTRKTW